MQLAIATLTFVQSTHATPLLTVALVCLFSLVAQVTVKKPKSKAVRRIFGRRTGPQLDATSGAISDETGARQVTARCGGGEGRFRGYFTSWALLRRYLRVRSVCAVPHGR